MSAPGDARMKESNQGRSKPARTELDVLIDWMERRRPACYVEISCGENKWCKEEDGQHAGKETTVYL